MSLPFQDPRSSSAPSPRVSVLVPAAASREILIACLESLERHLPTRISTELILVLDDRLAANEPELRRRFPGVRILTPAVSLGLAAAANRARSQARGELLVLLHDDAEIEPGWLEGLVAAADEYPEAGAIGSLVLGLDGRLQSAGSILWCDGWTSPPWAGAPPAPSHFASSRAVDYCGTASLLVRSTTWDASGGLDEELFPVYFVDVDLAMAVRRLGQVVRFDPRSRVRHHRGASTRPDFRQFVAERNHRRFVEKWRQELAAFDPPDHQSEIAVAGALARAERAGAIDAFVPRLAAPASHFDAEAQERRQLELALDLYRDWANELESRCQAAGKDCLNWRTHAEGLEAEQAAGAAEILELRARAATLAEIEGGRWWRLYVRLLPALRWLRWARRT